MTFLQMAFRLLMGLIQHPVTQAVARHAVRIATAELVREIQRRTRDKPHSIQRIS